MLAARANHFQLPCPKTGAVIGNGHLPTQTKDLIVTYSARGFRTPRAFLVEHRPLGWPKSQNARRGESPAKGVPAPGLAKSGDLELGQHERDYGAWLKRATSPAAFGPADRRRCPSLAAPCSSNCNRQECRDRSVAVAQI
jgi:hypothetical protein